MIVLPHRALARIATSAAVAAKYSPALRARSGIGEPLEERKLIERPKGRLMALEGLAEDDAFRWLRRRAMDTRSRIAEVARQVLANARTRPATLRVRRSPRRVGAGCD